METSAVSGAEPALSSLWDGLSPHLIASFYPVERDSSSRFWKRVQSMPVVRAPLTDCNLEISLGWRSPFEDSGQSAMPSLKAMLSSGALQPWVGDDGKASQFIGSFEGRTGITKLNSQQVFSGMPPLKFQATALFRAWRDPMKEVAAPLNQLVKWALPEALADDGPLMALLDGIKKAAQGQPLDKAMAASLLPSTSPTKLALAYKGRTYAPLVIESIGISLGAPVDANGNFVDLAIPMTICSLAAIDSKDWDRTTSGKGFSA